MKLTAIVPLATALALTACTEVVPVTDLGHSGNALSDYAASWVGYAEAYQFSSGSDRVRLVLDASGQGTLEFGDQPLLAPPTDPDVGYPPGVATVSDPSAAYEGFLYPIYDARVEDKRIQLVANLYDVYGAWCQMQSPVPDEFMPSGYDCLAHGCPDWGCFSPKGCYHLDAATGEPVKGNCGKIRLCVGGDMCTCTASSCDAGQGPVVQVDAAFESDGAELVGTLVGVGPDRLTVRLTRM